MSGPFLFARIIHRIVDDFSDGVYIFVFKKIDFSNHLSTLVQGWPFDDFGSGTLGLLSLVQEIRIAVSPMMRTSFQTS